MTRPRAVVVVTIVALALAGLASMGVYNYLKQQEQKAMANAVQPLVVAAVEIPIGAKLDITHLKKIPMPQESYPAGGFKDPKELIGRVVIRYLSAGDQITESKLIPKEGSAPSGVMTYLVPKGHRAVTVAINEVAGVAGFIAPNNRVDIILTTPIPNSTDSETVSKIVLQNVSILATGQITEQKEGKPAVVPTVTLDLMPEAAEKLVHASHKGSLQLLLRNILDTAELSETKGTTITKVLGSVERSTAVAVAKAPATGAKPKTAIVQSGSAPKAAPAQIVVAPTVVPKHSVEIIKGRERTTKEFNGEVTK